MDGAEEISGDFEWRIEALSDQPGLDLHGLLGTHATVEIDHTQGTRAFDGIVCEAQQRGASENGFRYDLVLRPWLHAASLRRNMRIFHDKTVIDIVQEVLASYSGFGSPHLDVQVAGDYPILEYTVQYGESDAAFVRRQLERHGISWSWRHEAGNHTLLLSDAVFSLPEVPGGSRPYYAVDGFHRHEEEHFSLWSPAERMTTGAVRLTEYNFKMPQAAQEVDQPGGASHPGGDIESYDWPGDYLDQGQGRGVVSRRLDAERGQAPRHQAEGDVVSLGAGWRVTLRGDDVAGATGRGFVCLKAEHRFRAQSYGSGNSGNDETPYQGAYVLMPDDTPFRPEQRTIGPRVQGPETAVVVGEGEIDCDEHGRILCQFHWDLDGAYTMRVRVSQSWASKGWGGMVIPRIGMEVIVEHLRGDPDKPIVTGCVFNGKNDTPYPLPKHKTRSTFKTDTHQGEGFNELRFEDENGQEEIYVHAQKDMNIDVLDSHTKAVRNNDTELVQNNKVIEVNRDHSEAIGGSMALHVGPTNIGRFLSQSIRNMTEMLGTFSKTFGLPGALDPSAGNMTVTVEKNSLEAVGISSVRTIGISESTFVGRTSKLNVGKEIKISAGQLLVLRCGKTLVEMKENGELTLNGDKININAATLVKINGKKVDIN